MHVQGNTLYDLDLGIKVTQNDTKYAPYYVICAPVKFEAATSNSLGGYALTSKYIIWP